jgi:hypothetical protein
MAPQLDAAQHILIKTLIKEEFETKLIASVALRSVRAVQRIRLKQFGVPTPKNIPCRPSVAALHQPWKKPSVIY